MNVYTRLIQKNSNYYKNKTDFLQEHSLGVRQTFLI